MAPKIKINYDDIVSEAINIIREQGIEAVTARSVAAKLNCSIQPVFSNFRTMDDLFSAVYKRTEEIHEAFMVAAMESSEDKFLATGLAYINFAKTEKNLFRLLFMSDAFNQGNAMDIAGTMQGDDTVIALIGETTGLSKSKSRELLNAIWFTVHGIASLLATNSCRLSDDEAKRILRNAFEGLIYTLKNQEDK